MTAPTNSDAETTPSRAGVVSDACSVPWPEEDDHDYYENETSHLRTLVDANDLEWKGWTSIAKQLNAAHGHNRTAASCRQKFHRISLQNYEPEPVWRDLGDGTPIKVKLCSMCGVAPSSVDDCGEFGNSRCPYFGKDAKERVCDLGNGKWDHDWVTRHDSAGEVDGISGQDWTWRECRACGITESEFSQNTKTEGPAESGPSNPVKTHE